MVGWSGETMPLDRLQSCSWELGWAITHLGEIGWARVGTCSILLRALGLGLDLDCVA